MGIDYRRDIRKRGRHVLFRAGGKSVCVDVTLLLADMGKFGVWMKIKERKFNQKLLVPMTRQEARILGQSLLDFGNKENENE